MVRHQRSSAAGVTQPKAVTAPVIYVVFSNGSFRFKRSGALAVLCVLLAGACTATRSLHDAVQTPPPDTCVVVLHGLWRTSDSMTELADKLEREGFRVDNTDYPSRGGTIEQLADHAIPEALERCRKPSVQTIHFVTHSMGGIMLRYYLETRDINDLGRTVMLGPPNQGSELIDKLSGLPGFDALMGPSADQLGTDEGSLPQQLGSANFEVGIIAGDSTTNPLFSMMLPGEDDGRVTVERARLNGMADFLVVPQPHTHMMYNDEVIRQVIFFLQNGRFDTDGLEKNK